MHRALMLAVCAACAPRLGPPAVAYGEPEAIPLVSVSSDPDRWYALVDTGTQGERLFFFDSGFTYTTCDDRFVEDLGVTPRGRVRIRGDAGAVIARRARLPALHLGGHELRRFSCVVRDLHTTSSIKDPAEVRVAGVLGADALRRFRVRIDPAAAQLSLRHPAADPLERDSDGVVPLRDEPWFRTRWRVPVDLGDVRAWPVVDTGATRTFLDGRRLGLEPSHSRAAVTVHATGTNGGSAVRDLLFYRVGDVSIGTVPVPDLLVVDRPRAPWESGLLGLDALGDLIQDYDFRHRLARFTPAASTVVPWPPPEAPPQPSP